MLEIPHDCLPDAEAAALGSELSRRGQSMRITGETVADAMRVVGRAYSMT